jgi:pyridinium-3,5-bisthiocarboxylic acid mononucleotide nickel chelatase
MKIAYLDCFSGLSGDMLVGALLDAGLPFEDLKSALETLPLQGYRIEAQEAQKNHIHGTRFLVTVQMENQHHRRLPEIKEIIRSADLSSWVKEKSIEIFESIAREEGKIHNVPVEDIHFHEVGATDSILDIVGAAYGIERAGIGSIQASALPLGYGFADTAHGRIPLPAPAAIALLKGIPVYDSGLNRELVTPTGAALVRGFAKSFGKMPSMIVESIGYGAGSMDLLDRPNLLRIMIGEETRDELVDTVTVLEANLDDMNPEWLGFLMDRLFDAGALDVVFYPAQMKKNRPGILVQVIGRPDQQDILMRVLFQESTTLGVRYRSSQRKVLERCFAEIESPWGKMKVKKIHLPDGSIHLYPEYEVCRKIALDTGTPLKEVYSWVMGQDKVSRAR